MKGLIQCSFVLVGVTEIWFLQYQVDSSLRKQSTFGDATTGSPTKWCLRNKLRNSIWMTCHYPDLGNASNWLNQISHASRPIRSTTQIWEMMHHQYGISALVSQASFSGETIGRIIQGISQLYHIFVKKFSVFLICSLDLRRSRNYDIKRTKWDSKAKTESWRTAWSIGSPARRFGGMQVSCSLKSDYLW